MEYQDYITAFEILQEENFISKILWPVIYQKTTIFAGFSFSLFKFPIVLTLFLLKICADSTHFNFNSKYICAYVTDFHLFPILPSCKTKIYVFIHNFCIFSHADGAFLLRRPFPSFFARKKAVRD